MPNPPVRKRKPSTAASAPEIKTANVERVPVSALVPYARNSHTHPEEQITQIMASIREFGFTNPVLIDKDGVVVAGHGRLIAAQRLGMAEVPCIRLGYLTPSQVKAYVIADNRIALNAGWDPGMLSLELADLNSGGFDLSLLGFESAELDSFLSGGDGTGSAGGGDGVTYTDKIEAPVYKATGKKPQVAELFDTAKAEALKAEIAKAKKLPEEVRRFLLAAAERHTVFNFANIAEFYAHADAPTQALMERSALVIIDFKKAVEYGYATLTKGIAERFREEHPE